MIIVSVASYPDVRKVRSRGGAESTNRRLHPPIKIAPPWSMDNCTLPRHFSRHPRDSSCNRSPTTTSSKCGRSPQSVEIHEPPATQLALRRPRSSRSGLGRARSCTSRCRHMEQRRSSLFRSWKPPRRRRRSSVTWRCCWRRSSAVWYTRGRPVYERPLSCASMCLLLPPSRGSVRRSIFTFAPWISCQRRGRAASRKIALLEGLATPALGV
jgi:hypothetical protein